MSYPTSIMLGYKDDGLRRLRLRYLLLAKMPWVAGILGQYAYVASFRYGPAYIELSTAQVNQVLLADTDT